MNLGMDFRQKHWVNGGKLVLLVGLLSLGACVNHGVKPPVVIKATEDFTDSFADMSFKQLPANEEVRLAINNEDSSFQFSGGDSFFEALSLPPLAQPYLITVKSELVTSSSDYHGELFFPVLTFLDVNKENILSVDSLPYVLQEPVTERNYMEASIQVSDDLAGARYMVIHTQSDKLEMSIARGDGQSILRSSGYQTMMYAPSTKPRYRVNFSRDGWVRLQATIPALTPEKPKAAPLPGEDKYF